MCRDTGDVMSAQSKWTVAEILAVLKTKQRELAALGGRKLALFGSYRHGTQTPDSDMDFLVVLDRPSFNSYMDTKFFLEDTFDCPVDLVIESDIKPDLRSCILDEAVYVPEV